MTRNTVRSGRSGRTTLGVLLALAVVTTAGAPALITIRPGDTLWDLARTHGTTVSSLIELNNLPGHGTIYAGQTLRIGAGGTSTGTSAAKEISHTVRSGETLSGIAARYGTTVKAVQTRNGLRSATIVIGRHLAVPGSAKGGAATGGTPAPQTNAGKTIPAAVSRSVAENRATLAARSHPSKDSVRQMVAATARKWGVSPSLAVAVAYHESGFQQRVVSPVNAIGVMQVLPSTGRVLAQQHDMTLDLLQAQDNITAGVLLLRQLGRSTGSDDKTLAGYYQGLGSIARQGLLPQTHAYIRSIDILRERFANA